LAIHFHDFIWYIFNIMKKFPAIIACLFLLSPLAQAQEDLGDKVHDAAHDTAQGAKHVAHAVGEGVKSGAHAVASAAKSVKNQVIVRCGNGRHALRRPTACKHAGGVVKQ
jgi:hypothetical protein